MYLYLLCLTDLELKVTAAPSKESVKFKWDASSKQCSNFSQHNDLSYNCSCVGKDKARYSKVIFVTSIYMIIYIHPRDFRSIKIFIFLSTIQIQRKTQAMQSVLLLVNGVFIYFFVSFSSLLKGTFLWSDWFAALHWVLLRNSTSFQRWTHWHANQNTEQHQRWRWALVKL